MRKEYETIVNKLIQKVDAMTDAGIWHQPWQDAGAEYPCKAKRINHAEKVFNAYYDRERITYIESEQNKSFYAPDADVIMLPTIEQFKSTSAYYSVKAHETIHSTGEYTRCFRDGFDEFKSVQFGSTKYSREELTAELGALFLLHELNIDTSDALNSASIYIKHWRSKLNNNNKWVFDASELAQDAIDCILER